MHACCQVGCWNVKPATITKLAWQTNVSFRLYMSASLYIHIPSSVNKHKYVCVLYIYIHIKAKVNVLERIHQLPWFTSFRASVSFAIGSKWAVFRIAKAASWIWNKSWCGFLVSVRERMHSPRLNVKQDLQDWLLACCWLQPIPKAVLKTWE